MKFTVITPCRNVEHLVRDTVASVVNQNLPVTATVEYIVVDGASTDRTIAAIKDAWVDRPGFSMRIITEADAGMYDALAKGLATGEGDVFSYLNAGDYYSPYALSTVEQAVDTFGCSWLTGMRVTYNAEGAVISAKTPWRYDARLIRSGYYGIRGRGRFIQQESTFWTAELTQSLDLPHLRSLRLAGDLFLWYSFASQASLAVISAHLGGFRFHGGHLSDEMTAYRAEAETFLERRMIGGSTRAMFHEVASWLPMELRRRVTTAGAIYWDQDGKRWMRD